MYLHMQGIELVQDRVIKDKMELQTLNMEILINSRKIQDKLVKTVHKIDKIRIINSKTIISSHQKTKTSMFHLQTVAKDLINLEQEQISTQLLRASSELNIRSLN